METAVNQDVEHCRLFANRQDAGATLAAALMRFRDEDPLVLGIPRGGVPVAVEVARQLGAELDIVIARKLGAPDGPEVTMGAVTTTGVLYINEAIIANHGVTQEQLAGIIARGTAEARACEERFRGARLQPRITHRTFIVVDDGLATGATLRATLQVLRAKGPARLVAAVPVGPRDAHEVLQDDADEVVCPIAPDPFESVSSYCDDFRAVTDEGVRAILGEFTKGGQWRTRSTLPEAIMETAEP